MSGTTLTTQVAGVFLDADPADAAGGEVDVGPAAVVAVEAAAEGAEGEHDAVGVAVGVGRSPGRSRYSSTRTRSFSKTTR
jgi:hypothetical protein